MLPDLAGVTIQKVGGPGLKREAEAFPAVPGAAAEAQDARRQKRNADHLIELRPVAMPADRGARRILGDQRVSERRRADSGEPSGGLPEGMKEIGQGLRTFQAARREVVSMAVGDDPAQSLETVEIESLEGQGSEPLHKRIRKR